MLDSLLTYACVNGRYRKFITVIFNWESGPRLPTKKNEIGNKLCQEKKLVLSEDANIICPESRRTYIAIISKILFFSDRAETFFLDVLDL